MRCACATESEERIKRPLFRCLFRKRSFSSSSSALSKHLVGCRETRCEGAVQTTRRFLRTKSPVELCCCCGDDGRADARRRDGLRSNREPPLQEVVDVFTQTPQPPARFSPYRGCASRKDRVCVEKGRWLGTHFIFLFFPESERREKRRPACSTSPPHHPPTVS